MPNTYRIREPDGNAQHTKGIHFHDDFAVYHAGGDLDDPHGVTVPKPPTGGGEQVSARPVPAPNIPEVISENSPHFAAAGTQGQSMTMQYNYNPVPEYTQAGTQGQDVPEPPADRSISEIAGEIRGDWQKVNFGAVPYLDAMDQLGGIDENFYSDPAHHVVNYFLSNSSVWRGETAKRVKSELKDMVKRHTGR